MRLIRSPFIVASADEFAQGGTANGRKLDLNGNWNGVNGLHSGDNFGRIFYLEGRFV